MQRGGCFVELCQKRSTRRETRVTRVIGMFLISVSVESVTGRNPTIREYESGFHGRQLRERGFLEAAPSSSDQRQWPGPKTVRRALRASWAASKSDRAITKRFAIAFGSLVHHVTAAPRTCAFVNGVRTR